jgi:hypothetical protein
MKNDHYFCMCQGCKNCFPVQKSCALDLDNLPNECEKCDVTAFVQRAEAELLRMVDVTTLSVCVVEVCAGFVENKLGIMIANILWEIIMVLGVDHLTGKV